MIFEMKVCGGCGTCAMACSFGQSGGDFSIADAKIIIHEDGLFHKVELIGEDACLKCLDSDEEPLCVRFCNKAEDLKEVLFQYREALEGDEDV